MLLIDNYDSFTHNVRHLLVGCGVACTLVQNDQIDAETLLNAPFDGFLISAGPCAPARAGVSLPLVREHIRRHDPRPLLGLCLGHQVLARAHGAQLARAVRALHGKTCKVTHSRRGLFEGLPQPWRVARYNSLSVEASSLPAVLRVTARDEVGEVMALQDDSGPRQSVQFHPESWLTSHGSCFFQNWCDSLRRRIP